MLNFLRAAPRCFVCLPVRLRRHELLSLASAAGFELQADSHALWITADSESRDIFVSPGDRFWIGTHRRVLISADCPVTVILSGEADRATSLTVIRANGQRESVYPHATLARDAALISTEDPSEARRSSFELRQVAARRRGARLSELN